MYAAIKTPVKPQSVARPRSGHSNKRISQNLNAFQEGKASFYGGQSLSAQRAAQLLGWSDLESGVSKVAKAARSLLNPAALAAVMAAINPLSSLTKSQRVDKIVEATKSVATDQLSSILGKLGVPTDLVMAVIGMR